MMGLKGSRGLRGLEWLPAGLTVLAAAMFVAVVIAFAREVFSFPEAVRTQHIALISVIFGDAVVI